MNIGALRHGSNQKIFRIKNARNPCKDNCTILASFLDPDEPIKGLGCSERLAGALESRSFMSTLIHQNWQNNKSDKKIKIKG